MLAMRPRDRGPEPVPVEARAYFSEAQIEKAEAFRTGQLWIYVAQTAIGLGVLVLIVRRPPERLAAFRRPLLAGAAVGVAISVATGLAALPLSAVARERAKDVGLVTQDWAGWAGDVAKSQAIAAGFAALGGAVLVFGMRRFGARWWMPGRGGGRRLRRDHDLPRTRSCSTRCSTTSSALPRGRAALRRARARAQGRRGRRRGLRDGRLAPHDRRQRVRHGPRAHQARRALRHAGRGLHAGRDEPGRGPRARPRAPPRRAQRPDLGRDRRAVRDVGRGAADRAPGAARRRAGTARGAGRRARDRRRRPGAHDGLQPALARRRAPRRRVLARADARPGHVHRLPAPDRGQERVRPRSARRRPRSCSARTRRRWSGSAWRRRSGGEVHGAGGREAAAAVPRRRRALPEDAVGPRPRGRRRGARGRPAGAPDPRPRLPRAARHRGPDPRLGGVRALARGPPAGAGSTSASSSAARTGSSWTASTRGCRSAR